MPDPSYLDQLRKQLNNANAAPRPKPAPAAPPPPPPTESVASAFGRTNQAITDRRQQIAQRDAEIDRGDEHGSRIRNAQEAAYVQQQRDLRDPAQQPILRPRSEFPQREGFGPNGAYLSDTRGVGYHVGDGQRPGQRVLEMLTGPDENRPFETSTVADIDPIYGPTQDPRTGNYRTSPTEEYEATRRYRRLADPDPQQAPERTISAEPETALARAQAAHQRELLMPTKPAEPTSQWGHPDESPMSNEDRLRMAMRNATDANMRQKKQEEQQRAGVPADWLQFGEKP